MLLYSIAGEKVIGMLVNYLGFYAVNHLSLSLSLSLGVNSPESVGITSRIFQLVDSGAVDFE